MKVAVCGASGGIGQPMSLLLKQCPLVTELSLYDIVHTPGVAAGKIIVFLNSSNSQTNQKQLFLIVIANLQLVCVLLQINLAI